MLTFRSGMAAVSRTVGAAVNTLCPLTTHRPPLSGLGTHFSPGIWDKSSEKVLLLLLLRPGRERQRRRCPGAPIRTRTYSSTAGSTGSVLHTSKTGYYDILRVSPNATQAQIKTAYYRQSFRHHPDKNGGSDEAVRRFTEISVVYAVLGNASLRRKYDRGVLRLQDVQSAGRPSRKDTAQHPDPDLQQHGKRIRSKPMFDFDAFYRAHYGEQLEREQNLRRWRERRKQVQKEDLRQWRLEKGTEVAVGALLLIGVVLLFSLKS